MDGKEKAFLAGYRYRCAGAVHHRVWCPVSCCPQDGQHLVQVVLGKGQHDHGVDAQTPQLFQEVKGALKVIGTADVVVITFKPLEADLEKRGFGDFEKPLNLVDGGRVAKDGHAETQFRSGPINIREPGI